MASSALEQCHVPRVAVLPCRTAPPPDLDQTPCEFPSRHGVLGQKHLQATQSPFQPLLGLYWILTPLTVFGACKLHRRGWYAAVLQTVGCNRAAAIGVLVFQEAGGS